MATDAAAQETTIRVVGRFAQERGAATWPFLVESASPGACADGAPVVPDSLLIVCVLDMDVVETLMDYELEGAVVRGVMYPRAAHTRAVQWGERAAHALYGRSVEELDDVLPSKRRRIENSAAADRWRRSVASEAAACAGGRSGAADRRRRADILERVAALTTRRGRAGVEEHELEGDSFAAEDYGAVLADGRLALFSPDDSAAPPLFMLGPVHAALAGADALAAALVDPVWIDAFDRDVPRLAAENPDLEFIRRCDFFDVETVAARAAAVPPGRRAALVGKWDLATRPCAAWSRDPPTPARTQHLFPPVRVWGAAGPAAAIRDETSDAQIWTAPFEALRPEGEPDPTPRLAFQAGLRVVYAVSDPGDLARAKRAAGAARQAGAGSLRAAWARPSVGFVYADRDRAGAWRPHPTLTAVDLAAETATVGGETVPLAEFWRRFRPFDACFAWEVEPCDVVVVLTTHETTLNDVLRAYDRARVAVVVVGMSAPKLAEMLAEVA